MKHVLLKLRGTKYMLAGETDEEGNLHIQGVSYDKNILPFDVPVAGTLYGTLLNYRGAYDTLQLKMDRPSYKEPPKAPVLYIKPKNTFISHGKAIPLPVDCENLEMGAALGIVIGKTATKITESQALDYVLGYTIVNDVGVPHNNFHRPAVKEKAQDGFCPIGPWIVAKSSVSKPNDLQIKVSINGKVKQVNTTKNLIRPVEKLLADVTTFMTLFKGDVLLVGVPEQAPLATANDLVTITIEKVGILENRIVHTEDVIGGNPI